MTYTLTDVNEESQGIYAVEMIGTGTTIAGQGEGTRKDEVAVVILRKFARARAEERRLIIHGND